MKRLPNIFLLIFLLFAFGTTHSHAATTTAIAPGNWADAIWDNGVPGCFDTIVIPAGIQVDVTSNIDLTACGDSIVVEIYGRLEFTNGARLKLPCGSDVYVYPGGSMGKSGPGGGSSAFLEICGTKYWTAGDGEVTGPDTFCDGGCPGLSPLPISLLSFSAEYKNEMANVELNWSTASETDNDYFSIERSSDGVNWETILNVNGAGNSISTLHYTEEDRNPLVGTSYYRLKQTDYNGDYTHSPVVRLEREVKEVLIYPNPVTQGDEVIVYFNEDFKNNESTMLFNLSGELIKEYSLSGLSNNIIINTADLSKGLYLLKINNEVRKITVN